MKIIVHIPSHSLLYLPLYYLEHHWGTLRVDAIKKLHLGHRVLNTEITLEVRALDDDKGDRGCIEKVTKNTNAGNEFHIALADPFSVNYGDSVRIVGGFIKAPPFWVVSPKGDEGKGFRTVNLIAKTILKEHRLQTGAVSILVVESGIMFNNLEEREYKYEYIISLMSSENKSGDNHDLILNISTCISMQHNGYNIIPLSKAYFSNFLPNESHIALPYPFPVSYGGRVRIGGGFIKTPPFWVVSPKGTKHYLHTYGKGFRTANLIAKTILDAHRPQTGATSILVVESDIRFTKPEENDDPIEVGSEHEHIMSSENESDDNHNHALILDIPTCILMQHNGYNIVRLSKAYFNNFLTTAFITPKKEDDSISDDYLKMLLYSVQRIVDILQNDNKNDNIEHEAKEIVKIIVKKISDENPSNIKLVDKGNKIRLKQGNHNYAVAYAHFNEMVINFIKKHKVYNIDKYLRIGWRDRFSIFKIAPSNFLCSNNQKKYATTGEDEGVNIFATITKYTNILNDIYSRIIRQIMIILVISIVYLLNEISRNKIYSFVSNPTTYTYSALRSEFSWSQLSLTFLIAFLSTFVIDRIANFLSEVNVWRERILSPRYMSHLVNNVFLDMLAIILSILLFIWNRVILSILLFIWNRVILSILLFIWTIVMLSLDFFFCPLDWVAARLDPAYEYLLFSIADLVKTIHSSLWKR